MFEFLGTAFVVTSNWISDKLGVSTIEYYVVGPLVTSSIVIVAAGGVAAAVVLTGCCNNINEHSHEE